MDIKQNKQSQREEDWGIALVIWGSLAVLGLVGVICGAWWHLASLMVGVGMLYSSWEDYKKTDNQ